MAKKNKSKPISLLDQYDFLPLFVAMVIVPLLIRIVPVEYNTESIFWYQHLDTFYDFFAYFKSQVIVLLGVLSLIPIGNFVLKERASFFKDKVILLSMAAMVIALLSTLFADSPYVAFKGYVERYEGILVVLSYWLFFVLAYKLTWTDQKLKWMFKGFWVANILLSLIGLGQYFGYDVLMTDWFTSLATSLKMSGVVFDTEFIVNYKVIGQTLYHYNYVAFFITLSFPIFITKFLYEKKILMKLAYFATSGLIFFNLLGSTARGGLLGVLVAMVFWVLFNWRILFKNIKITAVIAVLLVVGFIGFESISGGFVTKRILSTFDTPKVDYLLKSLYTENDVIYLETNEGTLSIQSNTPDLRDFDFTMKLDDAPIAFYGYNDQDQGYFQETALNGILIYPAVDENGIYYIALDIKGNRALFSLDNGQYVYRHANGYDLVLDQAEAIGFEGLERLGSGRGYIWSRTFPMVLEKPILGHGIDNFAIAFPQQDFIGKLNTYNTFNMIVDKAHNIYLQYAVSSGLIYLAVYVVLLILLVIKAVPYIFKNSDSIDNRELIIALFTAIIGFHVAGYFNDSSVHVAPVFWVMFGMVMGITGGKR